MQITVGAYPETATVQRRKQNNAGERRINRVDMEMPELTIINYYWSIASDIPNITVDSFKVADVFGI